MTQKISKNETGKALRAKFYCWCKFQWECLINSCLNLCGSYEAFTLWCHSGDILPPVTLPQVPITCLEISLQMREIPITFTPRDGKGKLSVSVGRFDWKICCKCWYLTLWVQGLWCHFGYLCVAVVLKYQLQNWKQGIGVDTLSRAKYFTLCHIFLKISLVTVPNWFKVTVQYNTNVKNLKELKMLSPQFEWTYPGIRICEWLFSIMWHYFCAWIVKFLQNNFLVNDLCAVLYLHFQTSCR